MNKIRSKTDLFKVRSISYMHIYYICNIHVIYTHAIMLVWKCTVHSCRCSFLKKLLLYSL